MSAPARIVRRLEVQRMRWSSFGLSLAFTALFVSSAGVLAQQQQGAPAGQAPAAQGGRQGGGAQGGGQGGRGGRGAAPQTPAPRNGEGRAILGGKGVWTPSGF